MKASTKKLLNEQIKIILKELEQVDDLIIDDESISNNSIIVILNEEETYSFKEYDENDFDEYMIQMVVIGQSIGNLDVVLKELSVYYERQKKLNYQIQDAITYPFVLILMMFVIVAALIFKVFPIFENILRQMPECSMQ